MLTDSEKSLSAILPREFCRRLLTASIQSLQDSSNPLAFNNFCGSFREMVRLVLSDLAPDAEIKACPWFIPDKTSRTGLTRAHAITYIVHGGLSDDYADRVLNIDVIAGRKKLLKSIDKLNKFIHLDEKTFGVTSHFAEKSADEAIQTLIEVLSLAKECKSQLAERLETHISDEVVTVAIRDTIQSIDEIATHHYIDSILIDEVRVVAVDSGYVYFNVSGTIEVDLQWGSDGDVERGDGSVGSDSYPFTCKFQSSVESPEDLEIEPSDLCVDTSSWWEDYSDQS